MTLRRLLILLLFCPLVLAAAPGAEDDPGAPPTLRALRLNDAEITRLQRAMIELGLLTGPATGRYDRASDDALMRFRREAGLDPKAAIGEDTLKRLEQRAAAAILIDDLQEARRAEIAKAREALLSDPATRDLVVDVLSPADATRDPGPCLDAPTVRCLLHEAGESAKAVADAARRDWAFSEILAVEMRAGLDREALETMRRIADPRRILHALRDIAIDHARRGDFAAALAAADRIPDDKTRRAALDGIARVGLPPDHAPATLPEPGEKSNDLVKANIAPRHQAIDLIDLALARIRTGDIAGARALLEEGARMIDGLAQEHRRSFPRYRMALARLSLAARTESARDLDPVPTMIDEPHLRAQIYARLADLRRRLGLPGAPEAEEKAEAALAEVPSRLRRIWTAADIARTLHRAESDAASARYLNHARTEAAQYRTPWGRARALARLALAYLERADGSTAAPPTSGPHRPE
ncbi:peptidoglycan-binding protein [Marivibrio halodurans]|uniref:Peptidoglycan-binding protein n=1 Tax=Marivibrio halodurans TaxID=2039722 RepID=A0A8J7SJU6_9PROT|nr:peptidoglycan-binding domain-containing protein [Marivibrio halodurans]MBP5855828.1 peptidoglycan-binding protein [Marivibrio halodurans]